MFYLNKVMVCNGILMETIASSVMVSIGFLLFFSRKKTQNIILDYFRPY